MLCPCCGAQMERGAIFASQDNAHWQSDAVTGWKRVIARADKGMVQVASSELLGEGRPAAYHCRVCRKIVIDLTEKWQPKE